jgi:hypothetical protein
MVERESPCVDRREIESDISRCIRTPDSTYNHKSPPQNHTLGGDPSLVNDRSTMDAGILQC